MVSKAEMQKRKHLVELMLAAKRPAKTYNQWLYEQHQAFISQHEDIILKALTKQERGTD